MILKNIAMKNKAKLKEITPEDLDDILDVPIQNMPMQLRTSLQLFAEVIQPTIKVARRKTYINSFPYERLGKYFDDFEMNISVNKIPAGKK